MVSTGGASTYAPSRRAILAGAAATVGTGWSIDRLWSVSSRWGGNRVGFEIKALPADEDPFAMKIARQIAGWFREAGIEASVLPVTGDELLRQVLIENNFDVFVARYPGRITDPDALFSLLHSSFAAESGWQNPFGFSSLSTDDNLERQRRTSGEERREVVERIQETVVEQNPFTVLAYPDQISAFREDRFAGLSNLNLRDSGEYFSLERTDEDESTLRLSTTDPRVMTNLNPLNPEYRRDGLITGFLYEPIARRRSGELEPWLAARVRWPEDDPPVARITLREDLRWHDGEALTATDVGFTYDFFGDMIRDEADEDLPATRYRGRTSLVSETESLDTTVTLRFDNCTRDVARRALTVPILPEHVWEERGGKSTGNGGEPIEAITTDNVPPVGGGPLQFHGAEPRERLRLVRFDDHFTNHDVVDLPDSYTSGLPFEELVVRFVGSDAPAVDLVARDEVDATITNVGPAIVPEVGRSDSADLGVRQSGSFYFVGYNARRQPLSNTRFRALLGRLIDRSHLVSTVFDGYGIPAVTPLAETDWLAPELARENAPEPSFAGEEGRLATGRVREAFTEIGYRYDDRGRLFGD